MISLLEHYHFEINHTNFVDDPKQRDVIMHFQRINDALHDHTSLFGKVMSILSWHRAIPGIYLYGPVGVGKTFLMDLFYHALPIQQKMRLHLHQFIQQIDEQLRLLQGHIDPVKHIAMQWSAKTKVLCLDEFFVNDVASAMILAELFPVLLQHKVICVVTSNTAPDELYPHGIQRERFLPVIHALKQRCEVLYLSGTEDYRYRQAQHITNFFYPLTPAMQKALQQRFHQIVPDPIVQGTIVIQCREIPFIARSQCCIWFDFDILCQIPRCSLDYLELAARFKTIFMSNVPAFGVNDHTKIILFMHFIDVMYDNHIHLVLSLAVPIEKLYLEGSLLCPFQRTLSRLHEMKNSVSTEHD